jgi:hypothetical protein
VIGHMRDAWSASRRRAEWLPAHAMCAAPGCGTQGQHQALGLQRLDGPIVQAMPKQGDQGLCARLDALMLATESEVSATVGGQWAEKCLRQFVQRSIE